MEQTRAISRSALTALAVGVLFVVAGIAMIIIGWPERTAWQTACLQLSGVMFAMAVAVAIWHMVGERDLMRHPTPRFKVVRVITIVGVGLGVLLYILAFALHRFMLAPPGQFFIWIGLGAMFAYLAAGSVRRELTERITWAEVTDATIDEEKSLDALAALGPLTPAPTPRRAAED